MLLSTNSHLRDEVMLLCSVRLHDCVVVLGLLLQMLTDWPTHGMTHLSLPCQVTSIPSTVGTTDSEAGTTICYVHDAFMLCLQYT